MDIQLQEPHLPISGGEWDNIVAPLSSQNQSLSLRLVVGVGSTKGREW
jgi:hypothetical protein